MNKETTAADQFQTIVNALVEYADTAATVESLKRADFMSAIGTSALLAELETKRAALRAALTGGNK